MDFQMLITVTILLSVLVSLGSFYGVSYYKKKKPHAFKTAYYAMMTCMISCGVLSFLFGASGGGDIAIVLFVLAVVAIPLGWIPPCVKWDREIEELRKNYCEMRGSDLHVSKTGPLVGEILKYEEDHNYYSHYEPEKIHIGGAMVGGVFSGGVYKTGGEWQTIVGEKNGIYRLHYCNKLGKVPENERVRSISQIILSGEAAKAAKESDTISKFLKCKNHELYLEVKGSREYCFEVKEWLAQENQAKSQPMEQEELAADPQKEAANKKRNKLLAIAAAIGVVILLISSIVSANQPGIEVITLHNFQLKFKVTGNFNETIDLKMKITYPDGEISFSKWERKDVKSGGTCYFEPYSGFDNDFAGHGEGTVKIDIINVETNKSIGTIKVRVK